MVFPIISNKSPEVDSYGNSIDTLIEFDITDADDDLTGSSVNIYVKGALAYNGTNFLSPFNGINSAVSTITDGYHFAIDSYNDYANLVSVEVDAYDSSLNTIEEKWSFLITGNFNVVYFSDGYGLKAIDQLDLVGEAQSVVRAVLTEPDIPSRRISHLDGTTKGGSVFNVASFLDSYATDSYGASVIKNETQVFTYRDGYKVDKAKINTNGTLYLINKTLNQIEAFYGVDYRGDVNREPDFIYNESSVPSLFNGELLDIEMSEGNSTVFPGGTRLYIGTSLGMSKLDTYDSQTDGYSDSLEGYGISVSYGISGSGADYEVLGGTIPRVTRVSVNDEKLVMFVVTADGLGDGGITQVNLSGNSKILFIDKNVGYIASNDIRDVFARDFNI